MFFTVCILIYFRVQVIFRNMQNEEILDIKVRVSVPHTNCTVDHIELRFQMFFVHFRWLVGWIPYFSLQHFFAVTDVKRMNMLLTDLE